MNYKKDRLSGNIPTAIQLGVRQVFASFTLLVTKSKKTADKINSRDTEIANNIDKVLFVLVLPFDC